jgi:hypothetical protein
MYDALLVKTVTCRTCQHPLTVDVKARPSEYFCGPDCQPRCTFGGCTTHAAGLGTRCWRHRNS